MLVMAGRGSRCSPRAANPSGNANKPSGRFDSEAGLIYSRCNLSSLAFNRSVIQESASMIMSTMLVRMGMHFSRSVNVPVGVDQTSPFQQWLVSQQRSR